MYDNSVGETETFTQLGPPGPLIGELGADGSAVGPPNTTPNLTLLLDRATKPGGVRWIRSL